MQSLFLVLAQQSEGNPLTSFLPLILIVIVFYLLLIRPQQKRARKQKELISSISAGDMVVTIGGFHGTVQSLDEDTMRLEISPGTVVTMARQAVSRRVVDADTGADDE